MTIAFIIRPFKEKKDSSGKVFDFEKVHKELIEPALEAAKLYGSTTGEIIESGNIREDMFSRILEADVVICDVTIHNANVFYELGIRHALRKKRTILIRDESSADNIPFDLLTDRYRAYDAANPASYVKDLTAVIEASLRSDRESDSPIFKMLPALTEANPATIQMLPLDFTEEVDRACAANSKGWLRLLAQDVRGLRFQWIGLRTIAAAQWKIKDYEGAKESLEAIRDAQGDDVSTNLYLANIYERLSRQKSELIVASNQAIERVLASRKATSKDRVEALTLKGRNLKTEWRKGFAKINSVEERRTAAMNQDLRESYEAYKQAFYQDLNHFYSGLVALQMGTIFLDLSADDDNTFWKTTFDKQKNAERFRDDLVEEADKLKVLVLASIEAGLNQLKPTDSERVWAEISKADMIFLTESNEKVVINNYKNAIPKNNPFAWDAAKGQLKLFAELGVRAELANKVIEAFDDRQEQFADAAKPLHLVAFVGHRPDEPNRANPRFPSSQAERAKDLIREKLKKLQLAEDCCFKGLASAAPGADILFHEVCLELGIASTICLPMPSSLYVPSTFAELDDWKTKYINLRKEIECLELSDREGLPRWIAGRAGIDPWERGNRWVLQMALTSGAETITLVALWDKNTQGDAPGGTAHMIQLARNADNIHVEIIDAKDLLS